MIYDQFYDEKGRLVSGIITDELTGQTLSFIDEAANVDWQTLMRPLRLRTCAALVVPERVPKMGSAHDR